MTSKERTEKILNLMRTDDSVDAPADAIRWVRNLGHTLVPTPSVSPLRRLIAVLTNEIGAGALVRGERSGSAAAERQMLFESEGTAIDLRIAASKTGVNIRGQIFSASDIADASITLSGVKTYEVAVDKFGEFRIDNVASGEYALTLTTADLEVAIPQLNLN